MLMEELPMEMVTEFFENLWGMTFSNDSFWMICLALVAVILAYQLMRRFVPAAVAPVSRFLDRHPLVWICIPAALLIYFVYVSLGWNLWVSVSDWGAGELEASYGFGGFGNYARMFQSDSFWPGAAQHAVAVLPDSPVPAAGPGAWPSSWTRGCGARRFSAR